jgi:hypothetical protein
LVEDGLTCVRLEDEVLNGFFRSRGFRGEKVQVLGRMREVYSSLVYDGDISTCVVKPPVTEISGSFGVKDFSFQGSKGVMRLVFASPDELVFNTSSKSSPGTVYTTLYRPEKTHVLSCDCPGWKYHNSRSCWHTNCVRDNLPEILINLGLDEKLRQ